MDYDVKLTNTSATPTAVVTASTNWAEFPALWKTMLDEVWAVLREGDIRGVGHNVMLYKDDTPNVEVGVQVAGQFQPRGRVVRSTLPAGLAAMTVQPASPQGIAAAHQAVRQWCAAHGHELAGPRWEIYGDPGPDTGEFDTEVYWLIESAAPRPRC